MVRRGSIGRKFSGDVNVNFEFTPDRTIVENIHHMRERVLTNVTAAAALSARQMQSFARENAPWTDQPDVGPIRLGVNQHVHQPPRYPGPHARKGIQSTVIRQGEVIGASLSMDPDVVSVGWHGPFPYGAYLVSQSGYFEDTAEEFAPLFVSLVRGAAVTGFRSRGRRR